MLIPWIIAATTVFPSFSIVGCYIAKHGQLDRTDMSIYEQMQAHSASPVLLHWDLTPGDAQANRRLPVQVFSPKAGADDAMGGAEGGLQAAVMKIDASEPERIAIDYIGSARGSRGALVAEGSTVEQVLASDSTLQGLRASHAALGALAARVDVLISFATAVQSGAIPSSPSSRSILRSIASLLARLPVSGPGSQADKARALDVADSALVELAGRLVESIASLAVVSEKASTGVDSSSGAFGSGAGATDTHGAARGSKGTAARQAGGRWGDRGGVGPAHDTIGARGAAYSRRERLGAS